MLAREDLLLALIAAAFLVYLAAGVILINASAVATSTMQEEAKSYPYD